MSDFKNKYGRYRFLDSYMYLTVKRQYQSKSKLFNRPGYHSDGFLTDDINYIWSDKKEKAKQLINKVKDNGARI